jgi:hypothetical protein
MQRALIQYRNPKNYYLVREALLAAHREDLIGSGPKCLIRAVPPRMGKPTAPPPKLPPKLPPRGGNRITTPGFPHKDRLPAGKITPKAAGKPAPKKK